MTTCPRLLTSTSSEGLFLVQGLEAENMTRILHCFIDSSRLLLVQDNTTQAKLELIIHSSFSGSITLTVSYIARRPTSIAATEKKPRLADLTTRRKYRRIRVKKLLANLEDASVEDPWPIAIPLLTIARAWRKAETAHAMVTRPSAEPLEKYALEPTINPKPINPSRK